MDDDLVKRAERELASGTIPPDPMCLIRAQTVRDLIDRVEALTAERDARIDSDMVEVTEQYWIARLQKASAERDALAEIVRTAAKEKENHNETES